MMREALGVCNLVVQIRNEGPDQDGIRLSGLAGAHRWSSRELCRSLFCAFKPHRSDPGIKWVLGLGNRFSRSRRCT